MPNIALITCRELPEPDSDRETLLEAVSALGAGAQWVAWDDPAARLGEYDLCVLRSTWNYHLSLPAFLDWVDGVGGVSRLANPAPIVRWNADKRYLTALADSGLSVVPTAVVESADPSALARILGDRGWHADYVVKPVVSAGSHNTRRFHAASDEAEIFTRELAETGGALVQPYVRSVDGEGERALVQIAGQWSHSVRKSPRFTGDDENITAPREINDEEIEFASEVLSAVPVSAGPDGLAYARVDVMRGDDGQLQLAELELIEPSLFLREWPAACATLARAIVDLAGSGGSGG